MSQNITQTAGIYWALCVYRHSVGCGKSDYARRNSRNNSNWSLTKRFPTTTECVPTATRSFPTKTDRLPTVTDCSPTKTGRLPTPSDCSPTVTDYVATKTDCVPTRTGRLPTGADWVPTGSYLQAFMTDEMADENVISQITIPHTSSTFYTASKDRFPKYSPPVPYHRQPRLVSPKYTAVPSHLRSGETRPCRVFRKIFQN